jgi:hypothetical protein
VLGNVADEENRPNPARAKLTALEAKNRRFMEIYSECGEEYIQAEQNEIAAGMREVLASHIRHILAMIRTLKKRRKGKIAKEKERALIPTDRELKRIARYRADVELSIMRRLEIASDLPPKTVPPTMLVRRCLAVGGGA